MMKLLLVLFILISCGTKEESLSNAVNYSISLEFERLAQAGYDPFKVIIKLLPAHSGQTIDLHIPKGSTSPLIDHNDGAYSLTVTPDSTGLYPVTAATQGVSISRTAVVVKEILPGAGQPLLVPGEVNTEGYEDGVTISPDGEYLFVQYGPIYFSGVFSHQTICSEPGWSMYDLTTCPGKDDSTWVFDTIGPYAAPLRPDFPTGNIVGNRLTHMDIVVPSVANKIASFPTVIYGFKRQSDGTFKQPFKVAFNDDRGVNGPFGISLVENSSSSYTFALAWNNYFNQLGSDKPDIYYGTMTIGANKNLGDVVYSGDFFQSITPYIDPVNFSTHEGTQGNPHLHTNSSKEITSIWTDDEDFTHDLSVYELISGTFPTGSWIKKNLPSKINTVGSESQPFFSGEKLYLTREVKIVAHDYLGGAYENNSSWGNETIILESGETGIGKIFGIGEPTIATRDGKKILYFAAVVARANGQAAGRIDYDLQAAFVELP